MLVSYWLRLVCLVFFCVGSLRIALSLLRRIQAPALDLLLPRLSARWQERASFAAAVASHIAALALWLRSSSRRSTSAMRPTCLKRTSESFASAGHLWSHCVMLTR